MSALDQKLRPEMVGRIICHWRIVETVAIDSESGEINYDNKATLYVEVRQLWKRTLIPNRPNYIARFGVGSNGWVGIDSLGSLHGGSISSSKRLLGFVTSDIG